MMKHPLATACFETVNCFLKLAHIFPGNLRIPEYKQEKNTFMYLGTTQL